MTTDDWQPIETAPKDGTDVLLWCTVNKKVCDGFYNGRIWEDGEYPLRPSHWMPLPPPPKGQS